MVIYMVCGFRCSGKDTLLKQFNGELPFAWRIYRSPSNPHPLIPGPIQRVAFADQLKKEVIELLTSQHLLPPDFHPERDKEMVLSSGKSFRRYCIERGLEMRRLNIDHWCALALKDLSPDTRVMVTDWRFQNELRYAGTQGPVVSVRVFRKEVPIPPPNEESEHSLDAVVTDYLLVPGYDLSGRPVNHEEQFQAACALFPQYRDYILC